MGLNYHFLLQNRIHNSLDIFLNGYSLNKVSKLAYPLIDINENPFIELLGILDKLEGFEQSKKIIKKNQKKILKLRKSTIKIVKNLFKIDQHHLHGCFVIPEEETHFFPETFFPLEILKYSTCIYGSSNLIFKVRNDQEESRNLFKGFLKYFEDALSTNPRNVMEWKKFYHMLLMLPTIYFQTKGQRMYKKLSFDLIRKEFSQEQLSPIIEVTWIMNNWPVYKSIKNRFPSPFITPAITKNKKLFKHIES